MAKGRQGFLLEAWKFGVYLLIPIGASVYFNDPGRQKRNADYWQFVKYPPSDPEKVREEVEDRIRRERKQQEHHKAYMEQMKKLQNSAERSKDRSTEKYPSEKERKSLLGWLGFHRQSD